MTRASEPAARRPERGGRFAAGEQVTLRRPWRLRRVPATVRRRMAGGWEVEFRTTLGTPVHLVLPARALRRS